MPGKRTIDAMLASTMLMGAILCIREPRESLRHCSERRVVVLYGKIRNGGKDVQLVQHMYEGSKTVVRCAVGTTESFKVKVGLYQLNELT